MAATPFRLAAAPATAALLAALLLPRVPAPAAGGDGEGPGDPAAAGRLFAAQCASCHALPDPARATDRAWIDQCLRTA